jgi:hypothetical protein
MILNLLRMPSASPHLNIAVEESLPSKQQVSVSIFKTTFWTNDNSSVFALNNIILLAVDVK